MPTPDSAPPPSTVAEPADAVARVPEAAIQDAWVRGLFDPSALATTEGEPVEILARGTLNTDSGPDVTGVHLRIGGLQWAGDVEIHTTSAAWEAHGHDGDPAYNRVILHVVLAADRRTGLLRREGGSALPELVLLPHLHDSLRALIHDFYVVPRAAPNCSARWGEVPAGERRRWVEALGVERLRHRAAALGRAYGATPDLDRLLIARAFRALGYEANADAFEALAGRVDLGALRQQAGPEILAALRSAAGLADDGLFADGGPGPAPMRPEAWKRGGRPANAPRRRIAQAAGWLAPGGPFSTHAVDALAEALAASTRAALDRLRTPTPDATPALGRTRAVRVLADAALPVLLLDAELRESPAREAAVLAAYHALPPVADRVTRRFADAGLTPETAAQAQGAHRLARDFCDEGRCARCAIGQALYPALATA
ncbi:DUF2851 family protein [Rubrivirga sp. IMCC43871]|uniref:DUF2851 family protein n=1 Tax=Rubrivirga sp. IMCC43871 TaxID=3391575 RepID=UPI00398FF8E4